MNLLIVKKPNKILSKELEDVKEITAEIKRLILNMQKAMKEAGGIGLAANQVGQDMQFFIIDEILAKEYGVPSVYINPEVKPYSKNFEELEEGCLSIPETWLKIKRPKKVKVKTMDENGKKYKFIAKGMLARVLQHEYDHLQGVLITDK
ncbi:MAG: peptide deformylase [Parcubacteria group bacterium RIFCSPLOWO2_01_FULL_40_65]|nr:MAG: peptide deformylase [Parcubacteria group bacterium RIFCSPHIGHO2_01_FULL_40_30]OHB19144.1 MAG: peptide deformylase [Parcubacteria group bacterium RIFCSPHIGHO2_02_FULL_40_12]OHB21304.1 MAG: peptide deformylase [Parcubacteria group bacterium RIFCSPLOWO2_01_FULL_40_65]OHB23171.1 MAG: peptide deformylase [Parcubacteria group bacterium RIFCSPLOWO2_02_FULL_40_12]OHB23764.1 MAG: peptide deformylase [Parcubacteria group bacterium RIFCSPLOWO2_12_FULL_40_10]